MFTFIISVLGVNTITQFYKKALTKFGPTRIHVAVGVLSLASAIIVKQFGGTPIFHSVMAYTIAVFASAVTLHQVIWKHLAADVGIDYTDLES